MRLLTSFLFLCSLLAAQLSAPSIAVIRDRQGVLRPLHGCAGAFVLGEPVDGEPEECCAGLDVPVAIEGDELVIRASRVRLKLTESVDAVERIAPDWCLLRSPERLYVVDLRAGREKIYALPEAGS